MSEEHVDRDQTDRFEFKRELGRGGMGNVFEVFDRERGEVVAIKTLSHITGAELHRFKREFRALADIEHPNLVSLGELIESDGRWFFTMDYVDGVDFLTYVRGERHTAEAGMPPNTSDPGHAQTQPVSVSLPAVAEVDSTARAATVPGTPMTAAVCDEARLRDAAGQLAVAVSALHSAGMVHRDLKPSNILVTASGTLTLLDFGLVSFLEGDAGGSSRARVVGTAAYMAPEQALAGPVTPAADWYSFGTILYEALTGKLPYSGSGMLELLVKKQQYEPPPPRARNKTVPLDLDGLCVDLLQRNPKARPSGRAVLERLGLDTTTRAATTVSSISRFTQTLPFVGREDDLARLRNAFDASHRQPVVAVVSGESGLGKSELARHFTALLQTELPDLVVLAGRCYERESVPYKAFDGIADALARYMQTLTRDDAKQLLPARAGLLQRLFPVLGRVEAIGRAPGEDDSLAPQEMRRRMFEALRELLARLSERHPVVLVVDDLQWSDADSLMLLNELLSRPDSPRLLLIATMRPVADEKKWAVINELSRGHVVELAALADDAATQLANELLGIDNHARLAQIVAEARGHPLLLQELARYSEAAPPEGVTSLDDMLWSRISRLSDVEQRVVEIVSVAATPVPQEVVSNALEIDFSSYVRSAATLRVGYFLRTDGVRRSDNVTLYHDRIGEVVREHLEGDKARHYHERLAIALERAGAAATNPQALVRHAEASGDLERAARYAEAAAHHAADALAFDRAAQFYETALRLGRHDADKTRDLQLALARVFVNAGRGPEAAALFTKSAEGADAITRLHCQREAAEQWLISGHIDEGLDTMTHLLNEVNVSVPATPRRALASLLWSRAKLRLRRYRWKQRPPSQIPMEVLTRIDVYKAVSHGLGIVDSIRATEFHARGLLLALRTGEARRVAHGLFFEAAWLATQGGNKRFKRAQRLIDEASNVSPDDPYLRAWKLASSGGIAYFGADFRRSAEIYAEAETLFREQAGVAWELETMRLFRLWSLLRMGAYGEMERLLDDYIRDATRRGDIYARTTLILSCHTAWLAKDNMDEAVRVLDEATWAPAQGRYHLQHWYAFRVDSELDLYRGTAGDLLEKSQPEFAAANRSLLLRIVSVRTETHWLRGRLALASARGTKRAAYLREALRMARRLEREQDAYATAGAMLLRAAVEAATDVGQAPARLRAAMADAEQSHLLMHAAAARHRLGELLGGDEGAVLVAEAEQWMKREGVLNPQRMIDVVAPGFHRVR